MMKIMPAEVDFLTEYLASTWRTRTLSTRFRRSSRAPPSGSFPDANPILVTKEVPENCPALRRERPHETWLRFLFGDHRERRGPKDPRGKTNIDVGPAINLMYELSKPLVEDLAALLPATSTQKPFHHLPDRLLQGLHGRLKAFGGSSEQTNILAPFMCLVFGCIDKDVSTFDRYEARWSLCSSILRSGLLDPEENEVCTLLKETLANSRNTLNKSILYQRANLSVEARARPRSVGRRRTARGRSRQEGDPGFSRASLAPWLQGSMFSLACQASSPSWGRS